MKKEEYPDIIYKRKGIKATILWEKTYYCDDFFEGTEKEPWRGVLFLYRFLILRNKGKKRLIIDHLIEDFGGNNKKEMVDALLKKVKGLKEWKLRGKHWKDADLFPLEVNKKLKQFRLYKYVKEIS